MRLRTLSSPQKADSAPSREDEADTEDQQQSQIEMRKMQLMGFSGSTSMNVVMFDEHCAKQLCTERQENSKQHPAPSRWAMFQEEAPQVCGCKWPAAAFLLHTLNCSHLPCLLNTLLEHVQPLVEVLISAQQANPHIPAGELSLQPPPDRAGASRKRAHGVTHEIEKSRVVRSKASKTEAISTAQRQTQLHPLQYQAPGCTPSAMCPHKPPESAHAARMTQQSSLLTTNSVLRPPKHTTFHTTALLQDELLSCGAPPDEELVEEYC